MFYAAEYLMLSVFLLHFMEHTHWSPTTNFFSMAIKYANSERVLFVVML